MLHLTAYSLLAVYGLRWRKGRRANWCRLSYCVNRQTTVLHDILSADTKAGAVTVSRLQQLRDTWWWYATRRNIDGQRIRTPSLIAHLSQYRARIMARQIALNANNEYAILRTNGAALMSLSGVNWKTCRGLSKT